MTDCFQVHHDNHIDWISTKARAQKDYPTSYAVNTRWVVMNTSGTLTAATGWSGGMELMATTAVCARSIPNGWSMTIGVVAMECGL